MTATYATSRHVWSVYRRARETGRAFMMDTGTGSAALINKRGVAEADLAAFRALLIRVGVLPASRGARDLLRPLIGVAIGFALALALWFGPRVVLGIGATASMTISTAVGDGTVTVSGETDLPDGAVVTVQAVQWDEWQRESADGTVPDVDTSPWVVAEQTTVANGRYESTLPIAGWPPGRGLAIAYFWVDLGQPREVIDRFGLDRIGPEGSGRQGQGRVRPDPRGPGVLRHPLSRNLASPWRRRALVAQWRPDERGHAADLDHSRPTRGRSRRAGPPCLGRGLRPLPRADAQGSLGGEDLEALAQASFFAAHPEAELAAKERAFKAYETEGDARTGGLHGPRRRPRVHLRREDRDRVGLDPARRTAGRDGRRDLRPRLPRAAAQRDDRRRRRPRCGPGARRAGRRRSASGPPTPTSRRSR